MKTIKTGMLLPDTEIKAVSIYALLSPAHWTLIVCGKEKIRFNSKEMKILHVPENTYSTRYILIKPDKHIEIADNEISTVTLTTYFSNK